MLAIRKTLEMSVADEELVGLPDSMAAAMTMAQTAIGPAAGWRRHVSVDAWHVALALVVCCVNPADCRSPLTVHDDVGGVDQPGI